MHRSYAVRYVKYELMVCHKTLRISLTKEYGNIYTAEKKKKKRRRRRRRRRRRKSKEERTNHEQLVNFKAKH